MTKVYQNIVKEHIIRIIEEVEMEYDAGNKVVNVPKGHVLYHQGDECNTMFVLLSGAMGLYLNYGTKDQFALIVLSDKGASLGEMGLLEGEPRNATAVALADSVLIELEEAHFQEFLEKYPNLGMKMIKDLAGRFKVVTEELQNAQDVVRTIVSELESDKSKEKKSIREKLKGIADVLLDVPKDVPPDLYVTCYTRTHGNLH